MVGERQQRAIMCTPTWALPVGGHVQVYKGLLRGEMEVAVKVLAGHSTTLQESFLKEVAVLQSCGGPHVVQVTIILRASLLV